ncbi:hypothetical protein A2961_05045 [Candidatus Woesebacteria bacterium RIFCSPLOWO2_01_FULL_39_21]|uniref:Uncharacterized protein n=1 Tax=Candidatus Woesebacteria bacterium RIFCSPLOWO2_01_FULL_39_21 TaxID=1802519 RepID=A0A1F8BDT0_9BACT|nr:MAG: hypothetical protein A2691_03420 [Candidatus Woesebacteria bacterium RIFCSPHIGHO2_01_FULL_39_23]OGM62110.1 MAG: hypothetical protein A2961_05045 [Candidatus Woesebacteria bacterium RIFCSPLOWO2_01_FULL_39_21]
MNTELEMIPMKSFSFEGKEYPVSFVETMQVAEGVECDAYTFDGDKTKDLGIIRIKPGSKTPLQKVLKGDRTVEGYISGEGKLTVTKADGSKQIYEVTEDLKEPVVVTVAIDEHMQWEADPESNLRAYEICFPPYEGGRYENIE